VNHFIDVSVVVLNLKVMRSPVGERQLLKLEYNVLAVIDNSMLHFCYFFHGVRIRNCSPPETVLFCEQVYL